MKDEKLLNEIENEVLFKPSGENLSYQEPKKPSDNEGVIIESVNGLVEEKITITTEEESDKLQAEVLFKSGIEQIDVREELS